MKTKLILFVTAICVFAQLVAAQDKVVIRFGHFPNITHAQGVIAHALSRQGKGWFEQRLGPNVEIQWFTYNAGPSAMEAMFAGSLDLTYVGQGPALNAHFKSNGARSARHCRSGQWRGRPGGKTRFVNQNRSGFSRQKNRHPATRKYPGHLLPGLAKSTGI